MLSMLAKRLMAVVSFLALAALAASRGGGGEAAPPPAIVLTVSPTTATVQSGQSQQFSPTVTGTRNAAVTWSVNDVVHGNSTVGTVSTTGLYTAPATGPSAATIAVKATSVADPTKSASATVTITAHPIAVTISPTSATVQTGTAQQFTKTVTGTRNTALTWSVNDAVPDSTAVGTISTGGRYTAPRTVPSPDAVTVRATSVADPAKWASATLAIAGATQRTPSRPYQRPTKSGGVTPTVTPPTFFMATGYLPDADRNAPYWATLASTGGTPPVTWFIARGSLPTGLTVDGATGTISGVPTVTETAVFTVEARDSGRPPQSATKDLSIQVREASATTTIPPEGGSAELPGFGSVDFPAAAFTSPQAVTLAATVSAEAQSRFDESTIVYRAGPRAPQEFRINTGETAPATDSQVVLAVPDSFLASLGTGYEVQVFAQIYEDGGEAVLDNFEYFDSFFDGVTKKLRVQIPPVAFTNNRRLDGAFEAVLVVGSIAPPPSGQSTPAGGIRQVQTAGGNYCDSLFKPLASLRVTANGQFKDYRAKCQSHCHAGVDFVAGEGTPVIADGSGEVLCVGNDKDQYGKSAGYGINIIVQHDDGSRSRYAHLKTHNVELFGAANGETVQGSCKRLDDPSRGRIVGGTTIIGWSDRTGNAKHSVPHLHYEQIRSITKTESGFDGPLTKIDAYACWVPHWMLTVRKEGTGRGWVFTSLPPRGATPIWCEPTCTETSVVYPVETTLALSALEDAPDSTFDGWGGDCWGTGGCSVTMNTDRTVSASFSTLLAGTWSGSYNWTGPGDGGCTYSNSGTLQMTVAVSGNTISGPAYMDGIMLRWIPSCEFAWYTSASGTHSGTFSGDTISGTIQVYIVETGESATFRYTATLTGSTINGTFLSSAVVYGSFSLSRQ